jgi:hypothetical protein
MGRLDPGDRMTPAEDEEALSASLDRIEELGEATRSIRGTENSHKIRLSENVRGCVRWRYFAKTRPRARIPGEACMGPPDA